MPVAWYTQRHMDNLRDMGVTQESVSLYSQDMRKAEQRARSRIKNAANRLGVEISTHMAWGDNGPVIIGTVRSEG